MNISDYTYSEEEHLLLYTEYCEQCNKSGTVQLTLCCCKKLCKECYQKYTKYFRCKYCSQNVLKKKIVRLCNRKMIISFSVFMAWYLINIVSLYLLQHYIYHMEMNFGELVVLMIMALNSSLAVLIVIVLLVSLSYSLTMNIIDKIKELCGGQQAYTDL
jgi:hypothetical protein